MEAAAEKVEVEMVVVVVMAADVPLEISTVFPNGLHNACSCGSRWLLLLLLHPVRYL